MQRPTNQPERRENRASYGAMLQVLHKQFSFVKANAMPGEGTKDDKHKGKVEIRRKGKGERVGALCKVRFCQQCPTEQDITLNRDERFQNTIQLA